MSERPSLNEIYTALADDPNYSMGRALEIRNFVEQLPDLASYCLGWNVTPQSFFAVRSHLFQVLLRSGTYPRPDDLRSILNALASWIANPALAYETAHVSEAEYMMSDAVGLIEPLKDLYQQGSLTYRDILLRQPSLLLP